MNKAIIIGNLTKDPELRSTQSGISVCTFTVAVNRRAKQGEEQQADFLPVVVWRETADICAKYLAKGKKVAVIGSIQTRSYQDANGAPRYVTEIQADNVEFLTPVQQPAAPAPTDYQSGLTPVQEDDLPF